MDHKFPVDPNSVQYPYNNQGPPGHGKPIEMQPMLGNPYNYGPPGSGPPAPGFVLQQPLHGNFGMLQPHTELFLDDETEDLLVVKADGTMIMTTDQEYLLSRQRGGIGGCKTTFKTPSGIPIFRCKRREVNAVVTEGDTEIGKVEGSCCGCDRSFGIKNETGGPNLKLTPTGTMAGMGFSFCNACILVEYVITDAASGSTVGSITCAGGDRGKRHRITMEQSLDVKTKALILAAAVCVYDVYFEKKSLCGYVGRQGSRCIWSWGTFAVLMIGYIIVFTFFMTRVDDSGTSNVNGTAN